jgi:hypothetical protein
MQEEERKPKTQPAGAMPPPRPPTRTEIGLSPADDGDDSIRRRRKKDTVRISLSPKLSATRTIKLPTLPPGGPTAMPAIVPANKWIAGSSGPGYVTRPSLRGNVFLSAALVLVLQVVLLFEAYTSIDRTITVLFLIVALVLSIPGYMWAFEKRLLAIKRNAIYVG